MQRNRAETISFAKPERGELGLAHPRRIRQHGLKYGFKLTGRARYDLQHLRRRRLLLERLGELARALLLCLKQPHVLDRDHRLVGERPEKRNLLIRKRINFGTSKLNRSDRDPLA